MGRQGRRAVRPWWGLGCRLSGPLKGLSTRSTQGEHLWDGARVICCVAAEGASRVRTAVRRHQAAPELRRSTRCPVRPDCAGQSRETLSFATNTLQRVHRSSRSLSALPAVVNITMSKQADDQDEGGQEMGDDGAGANEEAGFQAALKQRESKATSALGQYVVFTVSACAISEAARSGEDTRMPSSPPSRIPRWAPSLIRLRCASNCPFDRWTRS